MEPLLGALGLGLDTEGVRFWEPPLDRAGWLWKRGDVVPTWRRRWFVQKQGAIFWFLDPGRASLPTSRPRGALFLRDCVSVRSAEDAVGKPHALEVATATGGSWFFVAESEEEKEGWINAVGREIVRFSAHIEECLRRFAVALEDFARRHAARVRAAPAFRDRFARLCAEVGVDPLAHRKTAWSALGLGDYYMGLAIQVVEACLAARATSGGVLPLPTVVAAVRRRRAGSAAGAAAGAATAGGGAAASSSSSTVGGLLAPGLTGGAGSGGGGGAERGGGFESAAASEVTEEDVRVAIRRLGALGGGFVLVSSPPCPRTGAPGAEWVRSVPGGLDSDAGAALSAARAAGAGGPREAAAGASSGLTARDLAAAAGWGGGEGEARARRCLDGLAASGAAWVDGGAPDGVARYWLPGATAGAERAGGVGP